MANVQEVYGAEPFAANTAGTLFGTNGGNMGGFLCTVSGTLTLVSGGVTVVNAVPVTAGVFLPLPFTFAIGVTFTLAGGAAGTFAVN